MAEKVLESTHADPEPIHLLAGGKSYKIHGFHRDFFEQLQKLSAASKIELMQITELQMRKYMSDKRKNAIMKAKALLSLTWYWKDSGEVVELIIDTIPGVTYTQSELLHACSTKRGPLPGIAEKIIEFFTGEQREVYLKEDNADNTSTN